MYKRVLVILSWIMPLVAFGNDACTNPGEYTIDRRCYVTDAQKQIKPYNATVGLKTKRAFLSAIYDGNSGFGCTGTIIQKDGALYLYTAKHCIDDEKETVWIYLQNGSSVTTDVTARVGTYDKATGNRSDDWAVFRLSGDVNSLPSVKIADTYPGYVKIIGYGALKILSDKEIKDFKKNYIEFLRQQGIDTDPDCYTNGLCDNGDSVMYKHYNVQEFVRKNYSLREDVNDKLKISECEYNNGDMNGCQGWGGNSGGGIFDNNGNIVGIVVTGEYMIGGGHSMQADKSVDLILKK